MSTKSDPKRPKFGSGPNVPIPARYRCKVGGEWKPIQAFSGKQQQLIQRQVNFGGRIDAANSGMTCLEHSAAFRGEIRCDLCNLIKPIDQFSKSQRKNDDPMCLRCTAWTETQEPGVTPGPLETGHISIEEQNGEVWAKKYTDPSDFFPDDVLPQAPITALSSLGLDDDQDVKFLASASSNRSRLPPHVAEILNSMIKKNPSLCSSQSESQSQESGSSFSDGGKFARLGIRQNTAGSSCSISTATTLRNIRDNEQQPHRNVVQYNAWDTSGKMHEMFKSPTASDTENMSSTATHPAANDPNAIGWENEPVPTHPTPTASQQKQGKWHKAPRIQLRDHQPIVHVSAQSLDPDIDRQRKMTYCASDDSDY